jgi:MinD-like ATPase involved in chromosome partitioning or flagellar assembly
MTPARDKSPWAGKKQLGGAIVTVLAGNRAVGRTTFLLNATILLAQRCPVRLCAGPALAPAGPAPLVDADSDAHAAAAQNARDPDASRPHPLRSARPDASLLLLDGGAGLGPDATTCALAGDLLLLITTPAAPALADSFGLLKYICGAGFVGRIALVFNAVDTPAPARLAAARFARATRRFLGRSLVPLGQIPFDASVRDAAAAGVPVVRKFPACPASQAMERICARLAPPRSTLGRSCGVWSRVARLFL